MIATAFICLKSLVSSANKNMSAYPSHSSTRSFMYITNNSGPRTLPCGIPLNTLCHEENFPLILTLCLRLQRKSLIHAIMSSHIPYVFKEKCYSSRESSVFTYLLHDVFVINVTNDVINYDNVIRIHS